MSEPVIPDVGQVAPDFSLRGPGGAPFTLSEFRGDKNVLVVFYPLAFSRICSHQLPDLQKALPRFDALDTVLFGVSVDSHHANAAFARSLGVTFPLLSDWNRDASRAYGVLIEEAGFSNRASFLVGKDGRVLWRDVSESIGSLEAVPSIDDAIAVLEKTARA